MKEQNDDTSASSIGRYRRRLPQTWNKTPGAIFLALKTSDSDYVVLKPKLKYLIKIFHIQTAILYKKNAYEMF